MAITKVGSSVLDETVAGALSTAFNVPPGVDQLLVARIVSYDPAGAEIVSVTWAGQTFTALPSATIPPMSTDRVYFFLLTAPFVASGFINTDCGSVADVHVCFDLWEGVDQLTTFRTPGSNGAASGDPSANSASLVGDLVLDLVGSYLGQETAYEAGAGQAVDGIDDDWTGFTDSLFASHKTAAGLNDPMSWDFDPDALGGWAMIALALIPTAGSPTGRPIRSLTGVGV